MNIPRMVQYVSAAATIVTAEDLPPSGAPYNCTFTMGYD